MPAPLLILEAVPNLSTADEAVVRRLAAHLARPPRVRVIHVTSDERHGRTVLTALGAPEALLDALVDLGRAAAAELDLRAHQGTHPRVGVLDIVPLVAVSAGARPEDATPWAQRLAIRLAQEARLPCVRYDLADPAGRSLPDLRRGGLDGLVGRIGAGEIPAEWPAGLSADAVRRAGVTCVAARRLLVAFNVALATDDLALARRFARELRESSGGLPAVRALAFPRGPGLVHVAFNLLDTERTGVRAVHEALAGRARAAGVALLGSELVGCASRSAFDVVVARAVAEAEMSGPDAPSRWLETWLPGGARAEDPGLFAVPADPPRAEVPATRLTRAAGGDPRLRVLDVAFAQQLESLREVAAGFGEKPYRGAQAFRGLWRGRQREFAAMTDLPATLRARFDERVRLALLETSGRAEATDGTLKYLWRLADGPEIESVAIPSEGRLTFCVSSQAGCSLRCSFCATAALGLSRNLTAGEITDQCLAMLADARGAGRTEPAALNVVFMGMGEPGHNLPAVLEACRALNAPDGLGIGARHLTVSTSGVVPAIRELSQEPLQLRLAVSLHSPTQEGRAALMDVADQHPLDELLAACMAYHHATSRRVTFEYAVLPGINDSLADARGLATIASRIPCLINLIPYNPVPGFKAPAGTPAVASRFRDAVAARCSAPVVVRRTRGRDIEAACGMLHRARAASPA